MSSARPVYFVERRDGAPEKAAESRAIERPTAAAVVAAGADLKVRHLEERLNVIRNIVSAAAALAVLVVVQTARADDKVAFAGSWSGTWSNSVNQSGDDTLVLTEDADGNLSGKWTGEVDVTGMRINRNSFELKAKTAKRSYQITGTIKDGTMTMKYIVTRLDSDGTYNGKSTLTADK